MPGSTDSNSDSLEKVFAQMGDCSEEAANELYSRLKSFLEGYIRKNRVIGRHLRPDVRTTEVAHHVVAELFDAVAREKFSYQGKRGLLAWLIKVMLHSVADSGNVPRPLAFPTEEIPEDKPSPEQIVILADILESTSDDLDELAVQVFQLWLEGHSQREIADRLDCNRRRVRRILELIAYRLHHRLVDDDREENIA